MNGILLTQNSTFIIGQVAWLLGKIMEGIFEVLNMIGIPNIGKKTAYDLEIENDLASVYDKILDILSDEFGLSKSQAYDILSLGSSEYTSKVNAIAAK